MDEEKKNINQSSTDKNKATSVSKKDTDIEVDPDEKVKKDPDIEIDQAEEAKKDQNTKTNNEVKKDRRKEDRNVDKDRNAQEDQNVEADSGAKGSVSKYKTLSRFEKNLWTYGSPILVTDGMLVHDENQNKNYVLLKFINLNVNDIHTVEIYVVAKPGAEDESTYTKKYITLNLHYLETAGSTSKIHIDDNEARDFEIYIEGVKFVNGSVWKKEEAPLEPAGDIDDIEAFAKDMTKEYADIYDEGLKLVEADDSGSISEGIESLDAITWYEDVSDIIENARKKYDACKRNEERKKEAKERKKERDAAVKKRYRVVGIVIAAIVVVAIIAVLAFFVPNSRYKSAKSELKSGNIEQAASDFKSLHIFRNSKKYLAQCYYDMGLDAVSKGDEDKAADYFQKGNKAAPKSDYGMMSGAFLDYYDGVLAMQNEDYDAAVEYLESSVGAATDFNLSNKVGAAMAKALFMQEHYSKAWTTIKNVYAKDTSYADQYGEYGYAYATYLIDNGKVKKGMKIYDEVKEISGAKNPGKSIYNQAVALAEQGEINESLELLKSAKGSYKKAEKLYEKISSFDDKVQYWLGLWKHHGVVGGEKKTYRIRISELLYEGEMCLKISDQSNETLGFDTVISDKNHVTQISIGTYIIHFKLKKYQNQKFTYTLKGANSMIREQKYGGKTYTMKYKKKQK